MSSSKFEFNSGLEVTQINLVYKLTKYLKLKAELREMLILL
jgi:hypothetical protein